jgi:ABC-type nitrate/sulfonate/bicarbonate transport system substrate-binding protein
MTVSRAGFIAAAAAFAAVPAAVSAEPATIRISYFPGADVLPTYAALDQGYYAREGLAVTLSPTPGSVYQMQHLSAGDFELALTAMDNIVAYDEGQTDTPLPNPADFVAIFGGDNAFLRFYVRPDVKTFADLRGKTLGVDSVTTGFAFVLRALLAANGLGDDAYTLAPLGGTLARFNALVGGSIAGAILNAPFDLQGDAAGLHKLGDLNATIGPYQGVVTAARRAWLSTNAGAAQAYVRATRAGLAWMYDPKHRDTAIGLLVAHNIPAPIATAMLPVLTDPVSGMNRTGALDVPGIRTVLALRSTYAVPKKTLSDPSAYVYAL